MKIPLLIHAELECPDTINREQLDLAIKLLPYHMPPMEVGGSWKLTYNEFDIIKDVKVPL